MGDGSRLPARRSHWETARRSLRRPWVAVTGWTTAAVSTTVAVVQAGELSTMCTAALGTWPDWIGAGGAVATGGAAVIAWRAYNSDRTDKAAENRRNDMAQLAITLRILQDSAPTRLVFPVPGTLLSPMDREQVISELGQTRDTLEELRDAFTRNANRLRDSWDAHRDRYFAHFMGHPQIHVSTEAIDLGDQVSMYLPEVLKKTAKVTHRTIDLLLETADSTPDWMGQYVRLNASMDLTELVQWYERLSMQAGQLIEMIDPWDEAAWVPPEPRPGPTDQLAD